MKIFAVREFLEFKLTYQKGIPWNIPEDIFLHLYKYALGSVEREIEMMRGYFFPTFRGY